MIRRFQSFDPEIHPTAYVHPSSEIIGRVTLGRLASIWPGVVLRGDIEPILVGEKANIQDGTVAHTSKGRPVILKTGVTIGHRAILHGAVIEAYSLIGMGAILLDGVVIGRECLVGAGAVVPQNTKIPPRSLVLGIPAKVVRKLRPEEIAEQHRRADDYVRYAAQHRESYV